MKQNDPYYDLVGLLKADANGQGRSVPKINALLNGLEPTEVTPLLRRVLTADPNHIAPLSIAVAMEGEADDWSAYVSLALREESDANWEEEIAFAVEAWRGCDERLTALGSLPDSFVTSLRIDSGEDAIVRVSLDFLMLRHPHSLACHDSREFQTQDLTGMMLSLLVSVPVDRIGYRVHQRQRLNPGPMFKYHPERLRASRGYLRRSPGEYQVINGQPATTQDELNEAVGLITGECHERHLEFPMVMRERLGNQEQQAVFQEMNLLSTFKAYLGCGREIFDLPRRLVDMLALSDCDDLRLADVHFPYKAQYIHFGRRQDLQLAPGWCCDGAYVLASGGYVSVTITAIPEAPEETRNWPVRPEPIFSFHFSAKDQELDLGTAIDTAVARVMKELQDEADKTYERQVTANQAMEEAGVEGVVRVTTESRVADEQSKLLSRKDVGRQALSIVVNALCYLTAYPEDAEYTWPEGTPQKLRLQAEDNSAPSKQRKARQHLKADGFTKIRMCGIQFRQATEQGGLSAVNDESVRVHWRRGHFRRQPYGEGRQLRRLVWIMPVLVNAAVMEKGSELPGHIYVPKA